MNTETLERAKELAATLEEHIDDPRGYVGRDAPAILRWLIAEVEKHRQPWTTERPTVAGYYFFRAQPTTKADLVQVELAGVDRQFIVTWTGCEDWEQLNHLDGQWQGPLVPWDQTQEAAP